MNDPDETTPSAKPFRILLVEDDDDDADLFRWSMSRQAFPYILERVATLEEFLIISRDGDFDVVLLDLHLPRVHRYDGIATVREHAPGALLVVLTGLADTLTAAEAILAGADDYVLKSIDADGIRRSILSAWERNSHGLRS